MPNSIEKVKSNLKQIIDEVYAKGSVSSVLDASSAMARAVAGAEGVVLIPSIAFDGGLADYDKGTGANAGTITTKWTPFPLEKDRAKQFSIDKVDSIDDAGVTLAHMASEFIRTYVVPEIDAYRFSKYATSAGTTATGSLTSADIEEALSTAIGSLADKEVPKERLKLFISNGAYKALKDSVKERRTVNGLDVINGVVMYDDIPVYPVPANRFHTACTLGANGFTPAGSEINFMIIDSASAVQVTKHIANSLFTPEQNVLTDGYLWRYRVYHDAFVPTNKANGIYVHSKA